MPPPDASQELYRTVQRLQVVVVTAGRRAWAKMTPDFDASWARTLVPLQAVTAAGQLSAARAGSESVSAALEETNQRNAPEARVRPSAFSGVAADGRSLPGLLRGAVVRAKGASGAGLAPEEALAAGGRWLDALLQTVVTDAARLATQAEVAVRPNMGFVRQINPPCCGRCAILAGVWYRWNAGFPRHPRCDCIGIPASENVAGSLITSPRALFDSGSVHGLTQRERERIAAGDSPISVINESRDMWRARVAEQRATDQRGGAGLTAAQRDAQSRQGLEDLFASTRDRLEAVRAMRAQGFAE